MSYTKSTIGPISVELVHKATCNVIASYFVLFVISRAQPVYTLYSCYYILNKNVEFMHTKNNNNNDEIVILIYQILF